MHFLFETLYLIVTCNVGADYVSIHYEMCAHGGSLLIECGQISKLGTMILRLNLTY